MSYIYPEGKSMGCLSVDFLQISRGYIHGISFCGFRMDIPKLTSMGYRSVDLLWIFRVGHPWDIVLWISYGYFEWDIHGISVCGFRMDIPKLTSMGYRYVDLLWIFRVGLSWDIQ